jgi:hypothetical protein
MSLKSNKVFLKVCWQFLEKQGSTKTEPIPPHHMHAPTRTGLEMVPSDTVQFSKFPRFIFYCLARNQRSSFSLQAHKLNNFLF